MNRKIGRETFSYLLNKYTIPSIGIPIEREKDWGEYLRKNFKTDFDQAYSVYLSTSRVIVRGQVLELKKEK